MCDENDKNDPFFVFNDETDESGTRKKKIDMP